jgi:hypothetical protein
LKIGFYGHSTACWANFPIYDQKSFIDIIIEHYHATLVNQGVPQGSQERILFDLKKTKQIDLAVIFHSPPNFVFLPSCQRDLTLHELNSKAFYLWREISDDSTELAKAKEQYFAYGGIKETFQDIKTFMDTISLYKKFLYHPDLNMNRYLGALVQTDQYITAKQIPCIHLPIKEHIPHWFKFTSGMVSYDLPELEKKYREIRFPNNISVEGQHVIADRLIKKIDELLVSV